MDDDLSGFSMEIVPDSQAIVSKVLRDGVLSTFSSVQRYSEEGFDYSSLVD